MPRLLLPTIRLLSICALLSVAVAARAQSAANPPADTLPTQLHQLAGPAGRELAENPPDFMGSSATQTSTALRIG